VKSNKCELKSEDTTFCTTTTMPIQAVSPAPRRNSEKCAIHIASSTTVPTRPSWIATAKIWLCGFSEGADEAPS